MAKYDTTRISDRRLPLAERIAASRALLDEIESDNFRDRVMLNDMQKEAAKWREHLEQIDRDLKAARPWWQRIFG